MNNFDRNFRNTTAIIVVLTIIKWLAIAGVIVIVTLNAPAIIQSIKNLFN